MSDNTKHIQDWQDKVKHSFDDEANLHTYLFHTIDNFLYRYLETSESQNLKSELLEDRTYGAISFESNMALALKITNPLIKPSLIDFAKSIPKSQGPKIKYSLRVHLKNFQSEAGEILIVTEISWDFPAFQDETKAFCKRVSFKYSDLGQFRKELALKLEDACEIFL